MIVSEQLAKNY